MQFRAKAFWRRMVRAFAGGAFAVCWGTTAYAANGVPDWVKAAAQQELPHFSERTKSVVLLDETTYTVAADGRATEHVRRVIKILRPQGRDDAIPAVYFDKDSKVLSMHVWSIDAAGHEYSPKDNEQVEIGFPGEGGQFYADDKVRAMMNPPGRDPGGVVAYEYERRERPYIAETTWSFQDDSPRLKESFTLVLPDGFTQSTTWAHHVPDKGIDLEHQRWKWELEKVPGVDLDEVAMAPSTQSLAGRMTVHYSGPTLVAAEEGSWKGVGEWYDALAHDRLSPTPEITAKASELTRGKTTFYEKAEAIGEFVQKDIRYFVIEIGIGGQQPHPAGDIFKGRFGDCKDKATLLSSMLSTVGIHSAYLMVDSHRGFIDPNDPSHAGNHMIAAIEIPKGYESRQLRSLVTAKTGKRYLVFDPTWEKTPFGQLEHELQGSYGVLVEGKDSQVIQLPVLGPELNTVRRSASFQLQADGALKGNVTERRFGDLSDDMRYLFTHGDVKQQQHYLDNAERSDFTSATVSEIKADHSTELNKDMTTTFSLEAPHFAMQAGPLLMVRPRVLGSYAFLVDRRARHVPINLDQTMRGTDEFDIALPDGYVVDELPEPVKVDMGFASYESSTEMRGKTLHYSRTFTVKQVTLPADKYPEVQKLAGMIAADEENRAVLKRAN